jgi:FKBP-type peptidyl-prolyl cis-trans isomerase
MNKNNKNILLWCFSLALCAFMSCNSSDKSLEKWRIANDDAYNAVKISPEWKTLDTIDGPSGVYYQDLTNPERELGNVYPIETASVVVNYTGRYYNDNVFDSGVKSAFLVNNVVRGFGVALQKMRTGQKWKICIPYNLGYGYIGSYTIQGYTTLFFEVELLQINQHPK